MTGSNLGRKGTELSSTTKGRQGRNLRQDDGYGSRGRRGMLLTAFSPGCFLYTTRLLANGWHCQSELGPSISSINKLLHKIACRPLFFLTTPTQFRMEICERWGECYKHLRCRVLQLERIGRAVRRPHCSPRGSNALFCNLWAPHTCTHTYTQRIHIKIFWKWKLWAWGASSVRVFVAQE